VHLLLVTFNVVPSSPNLVILMMEMIRSYETSVLTIAEQRNIPEDGILHSHRRENLKTYIIVNCVFFSAERDSCDVRRCDGAVQQSVIQRIFQ
jgi:hypothetical protein